MSHRSRRGDDRDRSNSSHRYEKYEHRHRRNDSRDRDYYHSKSSSLRRDKYRSRSRSPSYNSKTYSRHHRKSRSRSPDHSSRHYRSRSKSRDYSYSRYYDDYHRSNHRSNHRSKDHKEEKDCPESKSHYSRENSQSKHNTNEKFDTKNSMSKQYEEAASNNISDFASISQINKNAHSEQLKIIAYDPNDPDVVLEEEKQRIQRETLERLQKHLEAEGKSYPPKKPQASHPIFANDGSFLEMFKSMQGNMQQQYQFQQQPQLISQSQNSSGNTATKSTSPTSATTNFQPINRRRGAKILKTGIVQKQRVIEETDEATAASNDSWNAYLKEVKRYKTVTCSDENMTRSLVK